VIDLTENCLILIINVLCPSLSCSPSLTSKNAFEVGEALNKGNKGKVNYVTVSYDANRELCRDIDKFKSYPQIAVITKGKFEIMPTANYSRTNYKDINTYCNGFLKQT
jgi:hypothetical protein